MLFMVIERFEGDDRPRVHARLQQKRRARHA
jgi:hypothetical protein